MWRDERNRIRQGEKLSCNAITTKASAPEHWVSDAPCRVCQGALYEPISISHEIQALMTESEREVSNSFQPKAISEGVRVFLF